MPASLPAPLHTVDLIRKKRDGLTLSERELGFIATGAASGSIPHEQLAAWLMAAWLRGLSPEETRALTLAMRDSGEKVSIAHLGKKCVDKHSTGGVGDKTSFLVAPLAAACGVAVPMISGRALGHTGGTLDKLESIPGFRVDLSLEGFVNTLALCGVSIVSQTPRLVPADRVLYALRDRTATVENTGLICASILSKKLAAGLDALVLDVKTGSGAFLRKQQDSEYLAALMVTTAESVGTKTVALLTDMGQPLGNTAGNWIEIAECLELLQGKRPPESEDLRELSLVLAGWMINLGGQAATPEEGYARAQEKLEDGSALEKFTMMVRGQLGDVSVFDDPQAYHTPGATQVVPAWASGFVSSMDTTALGWAVQRTGAGREHAGEPVDPHAGIIFHARRGAPIEKNQPLATIFATNSEMLREPVEILRKAIQISKTAPEPVPLVGQVFTRQAAEEYMKQHPAAKSR
jgi:pyrimidine-nucleoside phosphorylase